MATSAERSRRQQNIVLLAHDPAAAFYGERLRASGFAVVSAGDCDQARDAIHRDTTDLFVAVYADAFPEDCLTLCRSLRDGDHTRRLPAVLAATAVSDDDLRAASDAGALGLVIARDDDGAKLLAVISGVLAAGRKPALKAGMRGLSGRIRGQAAAPGVPPSARGR